MQTRNWLLTPDQYIRSVINSRLRSPVQLNDPRMSDLISTVKTWAGDYLKNLKLSGSAAKNLVVSGEADTDIFISLRSDTPHDLKSIYTSLLQKLATSNYPVEKRTVAIQTNVSGLKIDLVPGKVQSGFQNWHSLYNNSTGGWLQTNIDEHIRNVTTSGRLDEIRALKIWCHLNKIKFPSVYLELLVLEALYDRNTNQLAKNVETTLRYISEKLVEKRIVDPSNSNNIISDYALSSADKRTISNKAKLSNEAAYWEQVLY